MPERLVVLRDDDVNATTPVERLERVYRPLLEQRHKITFSVIPNVDTRTLAPSGEREKFIIGEEVERAQPFRRDAEFVSWQAARAGFTEIAMHGLTHARVRGGTEFGELSQTEAAGRMLEGLKLLGEAFRKKVESFVAPWDALSRGSLAAAAEHFSVVSTGYLNRSKLPPSHWPVHYLERLRRQRMIPFRGCWVLRHTGGLVPDITPDEVQRLMRGIPDGPVLTVIVLHHWMFWKNGEHPVIAALARELKGFETITLSEAGRYLNQIGRCGWFKMCLGAEPPARGGGFRV